MQSDRALLQDGEGDLSEDQSGEEDEAGSIWSDDGLVCSICMDQPVAVQVTGCQHGLCVQCAFQLTVKGRELPSCPFCRQKIPAFEAKVDLTAPSMKDNRGKVAHSMNNASGKNRVASNASMAPLMRLST
jgi:hypothetical protein